MADLRSSDFVLTLPGRAGPVNSVAWCPVDPNVLAVAGGPAPKTGAGVVRLWDIRRGISDGGVLSELSGATARFPKLFAPPAAVPTSAGVTPQNDNAGESEDDDSDVIFLPAAPKSSMPAASLSSLDAYRAALAEPVVSVGFDPANPSRLVTTGQAGSLVAWNWRTGRPMLLSPGIEAAPVGLLRSNLALSPALDPAEQLRLASVVPGAPHPLTLSPAPVVADAAFGPSLLSSYDKALHETQPASRGVRTVGPRRSAGLQGAIPTSDSVSARATRLVMSLPDPDRGKLQTTRRRGGIAAAPSVLKSETLSDVFSSQMALSSADWGLLASTGAGVLSLDDFSRVSSLHDPSAGCFPTAAIPISLREALAPAIARSCLGHMSTSVRALSFLSPPGVLPKLVAARADGTLDCFEPVGQPLGHVAFR
jgi:WD40 repeat protein